MSGFTIVELLIIIVVIAILATISIVAYSGIQARARDNVRKTDLSNIAKAVELYRADNGVLPPNQQGWCTNIYSTTYPQFLNAISPYIPNVPHDPLYANTRQDYFYKQNSATGYTLASELEQTSMSDDGIPNTCNLIGGGTNEFDYLLTK